MSGDSPNAFTNENVFDFKEGRSSPAPTTSKDNNQSVVTASVLVEPPKEKEKNKDRDKEDDEPDFSTPVLNPGDKDNRRKSNAERTLEFSDPNFDNDKSGKKEDQNLLNGGLDRLPNPYARKETGEEEEDDTCIVNCIYYTMECCKCSIV